MHPQIHTIPSCAHTFWIALVPYNDGNNGKRYNCLCHSVWNCTYAHKCSHTHICTHKHTITHLSFFLFHPFLKKKNMTHCNKNAEISCATHTAHLASCFIPESSRQRRKKKSYLISPCVVGRVQWYAACSLIGMPSPRGVVVIYPQAWEGKWGPALWDH